MLLNRTGFELKPELLLAGTPEFGTCSVVPWDTETFGFPVASYTIGSAEISGQAASDFDEAFREWLGANRIALCSCAATPSHAFWKRHLPEMGFLFVDCTSKVSLPTLQRTPLPQARTALRLADAEDELEICGIAEQSFHHGRYYADPYFPPGKAAARYRKWISNALKNRGGVDRVYVLGAAGNVLGFYHVAIAGTTADLRLAAVAPRYQGTLVGIDLYTGMLQTLKDAGVTRAITSISLTNTAVLNVYASLGFRFSEPEYMYHWHAPDFTRSAGR